MDPFAPAIIGHVPVTFGRYWADGLSPPPPGLPELPELPELPDPELPVDPELAPEPDRPLDPEPPFEPELDPEVAEPLEPELSLPLKSPELELEPLLAPEPPVRPEPPVLVFEPLAVPDVSPGSGVPVDPDVAHAASRQSPAKWMARRMADFPPVPTPADPRIH